ncbi:uncharacterized protein BO97DRAFT_418109 [Aspergillus homomorphus CBS 101889]|uniref:Uncharacterized protein n=1 Tax=Aspergillus homomorphus (strain CBS 101889) TaxID=1450537 RepID=A0A395HKR4_ASPHC|nr:hypothetical protein BO97DRAFT_418109 [Aspergillus homomorphus CBS 101889]RAL08003.1 hypothetical protein BO97DRAFT_418109 [Aspergillus homomorphus CBS 101889]
MAHRFRRKFKLTQQPQGTTSEMTEDRDRKPAHAEWEPVDIGCRTPEDVRRSHISSVRRIGAKTSKWAANSDYTPTKTEGSQATSDEFLLLSHNWEEWVRSSQDNNCEETPEDVSRVVELCESKPTILLGQSVNGEVQQSWTSQARPSPPESVQATPPVQAPSSTSGTTTSEPPKQARQHVLVCMKQKTTPILEQIEIPECNDQTGEFFKTLRDKWKSKALILKLPRYLFFHLAVFEYVPVLSGHKPAYIKKGVPPAAEKGFPQSSMGSLVPNQGKSLNGWGILVHEELNWGFFLVLAFGTVVAISIAIIIWAAKGRDVLDANFGMGSYVIGALQSEPSHAGLSLLPATIDVISPAE